MFFTASLNHFPMGLKFGNYNIFKLQYLASICILVFFTGCDCDKKFTCGALSADGLAWIEPNENDSLKFINKYGQHINFVVASKFASEPYESQACKHGIIGCQCDYYICESFGSYHAEADSALNYSGGYSVQVYENGSDKGSSLNRLDYNIFDLTGRISFSHPELIPPGDSLVYLLMVGNHTYANVYVHAIDTLNQYYLDKKIWKAYITKGKGIVGFWDRQTSSLFYRE